MKLTREKEQQVIEMYRAGEKAHTIQKELGISGAIMYDVLRKNNVEPRRKGNYHKGGHKKKKAKTRRCPVCKANNNPANARYCCMCGADIRNEADIVLEKLDKAMTVCIKLLPTDSTEAVLDAMRQAKKLIEREA
jgi:hypothetical protein